MAYNIKQFLMATGLLTGALSVLLVMTLMVSPVLSGQLMHAEKKQTLALKLSVGEKIKKTHKKLKKDATTE